MRIESRKHPRSVFIFIIVVKEIHDTDIVCNKRTFICLFILFILYRAFFYSFEQELQELGKESPVRMQRLATELIA